MAYHVEAAIRVRKALPDSFHERDVKGAIKILAQAKIESGKEMEHPAWKKLTEIIDELWLWDDKYESFLEGYKPEERMPELPSRALIGAVWALGWIEAENTPTDISGISLEELLHNDGHRSYDKRWPSAFLIKADKTALTFEDWCERLAKEGWVLHAGYGYWSPPNGTPYPKIHLDELELYCCSDYDKARLEPIPKFKARIVEPESPQESNANVIEFLKLQSRKERHLYGDGGRTSNKRRRLCAGRASEKRLKAEEVTGAIKNLSMQCILAQKEIRSLNDQHRAALEKVRSLGAQRKELKSSCEEWEEQINQLLDQSEEREAQNED